MFTNTTHDGIIGFVLTTMETEKMIASYTIEIYEIDCSYADDKYCAVFEGYDGAPDAHDSTGRGNTHGEAMRDLIENYRFEGE